ncbi:SpaA isopeptide-forming pilin-related protein [Pseudobutyrivibrio xylanivorans]|uniref:LPXTG-motif cell wall anchor domain-containing protein/fibro-slime domain-containing protein n=1 Tax=Pseudobutyrivibrio xylanivorans DSM 14809 TaxID=1123012 RepID=A0A1M6DQB0_PSEXY|nr:SpaA isopeptide-forming pilin-related protein [Pseudobutyrivibrio xylanivorans]SHI75392.1 LPXTG-motif cell wall anchor domain-containing protein/fibro-slime domain-containing protein [Pseudobutyrivibrio xylanivorans DSM 14809]
MKKYPILRRLLCCSLSVAMLFSTQVAVYAAEIDGGDPGPEIISNTEFSNSQTSNTNSEDISTNLSNTQNNSEEVSSKNKNSSEEENIPESLDDDSQEVSDEKEVETENSNAKEKETSAEVSKDKTFNVKKGDFYITAFVPEGTFDADVEFKADRINLSTSEQKLVSDAVDNAEVEDYYAFDLRFEADGEEIEPREGSSVKISIESSSISANAVVHIKDDNTAEEVKSDIKEDKIIFESDSFSTYVVTEAIEKLNDGNTLYSNTLYGSAEVLNKEYNFIKGTNEENGANKGRIAFRIYQQNNENYTPYEIAPHDNGRCFQYGSDKAGDFTFRFQAPENYYVAKVTLYEDNGTDFYKNSALQTVNVDGYKTDCEVTLYLRGMEGGNKFVNAVVVDLEPMPSFYVPGKNQYVEHATFVNFINGNFYGKVAGNENKVFGDQFMFGSGQTGAESNHCSYGQVYQGLAASTLTNGVFRLANDNGKTVFPNFDAYNYEKWAASQPWLWHTDKYSYIDEYYNDTLVQFGLDEEGYWTLDSSQYKYVTNYDYNLQKYKLEPTAGSQFRPFKPRTYKNSKGEESLHEENHFGMILPINFCVAEDGLTEEGKDTIFKFFGDDDVFVYVDGQLVLDLGGIHNAVRGQINFRTGDIVIQGDRENQLTSSLAGDDSCYVTLNNGSVAKGIGTTNLYDLISENDVSSFSKKEHVLTVVYFERGAHESNCKISYNFTKTETRTADFTGLKVDENMKGLKNAEFTLYTDEECTNVATMGIGVPAVVTSDENGTIKFTDLSAGVIPRGSDSVTKTYYLKETKAPEEYMTPEGALWKLELTAYSDSKKDFSKKLYALNSEAEALSFDINDNNVHKSSTNVNKIKNNPLKFAKKLTVSKKVTYGTDKLQDNDAQYVFVIEQLVGKVRTAMANQSFKIGDKETKTNEYGQFVLKAGEVAVFENLMETQYQITETFVLSNNGYKLENYDTKITVDSDDTKAITYKHDVEGNRSVLIDFESIGENKVKSVANEKAAEFENNLVKVFDWQLIKISKTSRLALMGAEFTLVSKEKGSTDKYYGKSDANGVVLWYKSVSDRDKNRNPIEVSVGSYTLSETKAPGGYAKSEDVWQITIDRDNGVQAYISNPGDLAGNTVYEEQTLENGGVLKTVKLSFENEVSYTLPNTGGSGIQYYTIGGILLLLVAALLLYKDKKKYI